MSNLDALRLVLIVLPAIDLLAAVILWRAVRRADNDAPDALVDRAMAATVIWVAASIVAIAALAGLLRIGVPPDTLLAVVALGVMLPSLTSLLWVWRYWRGGFGGGP